MALLWLPRAQEQGLRLGAGAQAAATACPGGGGGRHFVPVRDTTPARGPTKQQLGRSRATCKGCVLQGHATSQGGCGSEPPLPVPPASCEAQLPPLGAAPQGRTSLDARLPPAAGRTGRQRALLCTPTRALPSDACQAARRSRSPVPACRHKAQPTFDRAGGDDAFGGAPVAARHDAGFVEVGP